MSASILKIALPYIVEILTYIYNCCIKFNLFPTTWKLAKVVPVPKTLDGSDKNNFRPISILPVLSKPLERHIQKHVADFIENNNLFHKLQSGFRRYHSCTTALTHMCDTWLSAINNLKMTGVVFLDFSKAFDLIDHSVLISKLQVYLQNKDTICLIKSFLEHRHQCVALNGTFSETREVLLGVP